MEARRELESHSIAVAGMKSPRAVSEAERLRRCPNTLINATCMRCATLDLAHAQRIVAITDAGDQGLIACASV